MPDINYEILAKDAKFYLERDVMEINKSVQELPDGIEKTALSALLDTFEHYLEHPLFKTVEAEQYDLSE